MAGNASQRLSGRKRSWAARLLLMAMVAIALVLVAPRVEHADPGYASVDEPFLTPHSFVELSDQPVCSLLDDLQNEAHLIGQDGATSVEADGQVFWSFNDTWVETACGAHMLIPNSIASTDDREASDCVSLTSQAVSGFAVPTLSRNAGEVGVFPSGMFSIEPGYVHLFYASAVNDHDRGGFIGPNAWNLAPPDGRIRIDDILAAVRSYMQDCP